MMSLHRLGHRRIVGGMVMCEAPLGCGALYRGPTSDNPSPRSQPISAVHSKREPLAQTDFTVAKWDQSGGYPRGRDLVLPGHTARWSRYPHDVHDRDAGMAAPHRR